MTTIPVKRSSYGSSISSISKGKASARRASLTLPFPFSKAMVVDLPLAIAATTALLRVVQG
jgi:hypothetical protein